MTYTLIGSQTSPFVRRIRMLLEGKEFTLKEFNIFETADSIELNNINPLNQVPVLIDGERKIIDSRVIFHYLNMIHRFENFDWEDENTLSIIDGGMNSGVNLLLMKRSGMPIHEPLMFVNRQKERVESVLDTMTPFASTKGLTTWNFHSMSLYCFLDWGVFRGLFSIDNRPELQNFLSTHKDRDCVVKTQIPKL